MCKGSDFASPFDALPQGFMPSEGYGGTLPGVMPSDPFPTTTSPVPFTAQISDYLSSMQTPAAPAATPTIAPSFLGGPSTGAPPPPASFTGEERRGVDRKSTRLNSSHMSESRMPSSA